MTPICPDQKAQAQAIQVSYKCSLRSLTSVSGDSATRPEQARKQ